MVRHSSALLNRTESRFKRAFYSCFCRLNGIQYEIQNKFKSDETEIDR